MSDFGDFMRQIPIQIVLAPLVFGALYIASMVYIISRSRRRRAEKARQQAANNPQEPAKPKINRSPLNVMGFLRGELPENPSEPAAWTVPSTLRDIPEPDLEMLVPAVAADRPPTTAQPVTDILEEVVAQKSQSSVSALNNPVDSKQERIMPPVTNPQEQSPASHDLVEVMRIYRDLGDGSLIVQIGNQQYRSISEMSSPDLLRRVKAIARDLWAMVNGSQQSAPAAVGEKAQPAAGMNDAASPPRIGLMNAAAPEPEAPSIMKQFTRAAMGQSKSTQPEAPAGIAGAVEEFLQYKLSQNPTFSSRSIHIRPAPDHGVKIEVDGHFYEAIGDVVEPDAREFLLEIMREWDARH